jgi:integrase/recombinase XerD
LRLSTAVTEYVKWKRLRGARFETGEWLFGSLLQRIGDGPLNSITAKQVSAFLDGSSMAPHTWWHTYRMIRSFFQFWIARRQLAGLPMPRPRVALSPPFRPYIYSIGELVRLMKSIKRNQRERSCRLDPITFRTILLFIYGTGSTVHEVLNLRLPDVDLRNGMVTLRRVNIGAKRTLPIGHTIHVALRTYLSSSAQRRGDKDFVFLNSEGNSVSRLALTDNFRRLCSSAQLSQEHGISRTPGVYDLRHTFAVHCLDAWLKQGKDLGCMLPVLSGYMGHVSWSSTEQYLRLVPERFSKQLSKLDLVQLG